MTKKLKVFEGLAQLSGPSRSWKSRADLIHHLGWDNSVSPLLNRLVAEGRVEQGKWEGEGVGGRMCDGFRPALAKPTPKPALRAALKELDEVKLKIEVIARILKEVA